MFMTVTCPKCGRGIKAKKKYILSTGGLPCLRCKVRIPISKEQVEAYSSAAAVAEEAPEETPVSAPTLEGAAPDSTPKDDPAPALAVPAEPEPVAVEPESPPDSEPEPVFLSEPASPGESEERPSPMVLPATDDVDSITPAIANEPEPEAPAVETAPPPAAGKQITFTCPHCQTVYPLRQTLAGKKIRCKDCSRIVKVAPDSPVISGISSPPAPTPPPPPPPEDDIPVLFSSSEPPAPEPLVVEPEAPVASRPAPPAIPEPSSDTGPAHETILRLRKALAEADERANSAEDMLQQVTRDKSTGEMTAFRKTRDLEAQIRDLTARLKAKEEESRTTGQGGLKRSEVEALLNTLCEALDANLKHEIQAHQTLVDDLKHQLTQALQ